MSMFERISPSVRTAFAVPLLALALCAGATACGTQQTATRTDSKPPAPDPCADAMCTRTLGAGDSIRPLPEHGIESFTVDRIEAGSVDWTVRFNSGNVAISASGASTKSSCSNGVCSGEFRGQSGTLKLNRVEVHFMNVTPNSVTVRLSRAEA